MSDRLITISGDAPLSDAHRRMREMHIRHLPVVDELGKIQGILSDRDVKRALEPILEPFATSAVTFEFDPTHRVRDFMSWPVRTINQSAPVETAVHQILEGKLSALLVVSADEKPCGIVTTDDFLSLLAFMLDQKNTEKRAS